jgi:phage portal protein BeeE
MDGSSITYQNVETRWTDIIRSGVMPWMTRWRHVLRRMLPPSDDLVFLPDRYLQADTKTRWETYAVGIEAGFTTPAEVRRLDPLLEGGGPTR